MMIEKRTYMKLGISAADLQLGEIDHLLSVRHTTGWHPGDSYQSCQKIDGEIRSVIRTRPIGVWHFYTSDFMESPELEDHARFLIERMEPAAAAIKLLMQRPGYTVGITSLHIGDLSFSLPSDVLCRLATISQWMSFTCWESDEIEEEKAT